MTASSSANSHATPRIRRLRLRYGSRCGEGCTEPWPTCQCAINPPSGFRQESAAVTLVHPGREGQTTPQRKAGTEVDHAPVRSRKAPRHNGTTARAQGRLRPSKFWYPPWCSKWHLNSAPWVPGIPGTRGARHQRREVCQQRTRRVSDQGPPREVESPRRGTPTRHVQGRPDRMLRGVASSARETASTVTL